MENLLGKTFTHRQKVTQAMLASNLVPGTPGVFGTPSLVAFIEETAYLMMKPYYNEGETSVGVSIQLTHSSPTPLYMEVSCTVKVEAVDKKLFTFSVVAEDETGEIGTGTHVRAIVNKEKIQKKADEKNYPGGCFSR